MKNEFVPPNDLSCRHFGFWLFYTRLSSDMVGFSETRAKPPLSFYPAETLLGRGTQSPPQHMRVRRALTQIGDPKPLDDPLQNIAPCKTEVSGRHQSLLTHVAVAWLAFSLPRL